MVNRQEFYPESDFRMKTSCAAATGAHDVSLYGNAAVCYSLAPHRACGAVRALAWLCCGVGVWVSLKRAKGFHPLES